MEKGSYRQWFASAAEAMTYEELIYGTGSYGQLLWEVEKDLLRQALARIPLAHGEIDYLDFACGTGRVLSFMEGKVAHARGIDTSAAMLQVAHGNVVRAQLMKVDVSVPETPIEGSYDIITAFRFVLNAEPELRIAGLRALAARLRDDRSRLIFNVHGHVPSHKSLPRLAHRLGASPHTRSSYTSNSLTAKDVRGLVAAAGLQIERRLGYDLLSSKAIQILGREKLLQLEYRLASRSIARVLGGHQMYIVKKLVH